MLLNISESKLVNLIIVNLIIVNLMKVNGLRERSCCWRQEQSRKRKQTARAIVQTRRPNMVRACVQEMDIERNEKKRACVASGDA